MCRGARARVSSDWRWNRTTCSNSSIAQKCDDHGSCWPSAMISTTFVPGRQNIPFASAAPNSHTMMSAPAKVRACSSNDRYVRLDRREAETLERLDHCCAVDDVAAVPQAAADEDSFRRTHRGRLFPDVGQNCGEGFLMLRMRVLAADPAVPVAGDRMFEKHRPRRKLANKAGRDVEPRDQRALPGP